MLSQNVDGLSARLDAVLWKIKGLHQTKPLLAVFFQEHHLHRARAAGINATQKARNLGFHLILNPPPDNERKGGTAILIPYDQIEIKKDEHGLDAAVARVDATVKKTQDGRFTSCDVTLNGSTIRLATAYAPQSPPQRVQFFKDIKPLINKNAIFGLDANCVPDPTVDLKRDDTTTPYDNRGADELEDAILSHDLTDTAREYYGDTPFFTNVHNTVTRARGEVVPTPGITAAQVARGVPHPGHHTTPWRPGVHISRPGVRA